MAIAPVYVRNIPNVLTITFGWWFCRTELDIKCIPQGSKTQTCDANRLNAQAQLYAAILKTCLEAKSCKSFETWGFVDSHSWVSQGLTFTRACKKLTAASLNWFKDRGASGAASFRPQLRAQAGCFCNDQFDAKSKLVGFKNLQVL